MLLASECPVLSRSVSYQCVCDCRCANLPAFGRISRFLGVLPPSCAGFMKSCCWITSKIANKTWGWISLLLGATNTRHLGLITLSHFGKLARLWLVNVSCCCVMSEVWLGMLARPGIAHLVFSRGGGHYTWRKVTTTIHNIIVGRLWVDNHGEMDITNHRTGDVCHLKYAAYSYFSRDMPHKVCCIQHSTMLCLLCTFSSSAWFVYISISVSFLSLRPDWGSSGYVSQWQ